MAHRLLQGLRILILLSITDHAFSYSCARQEFFALYTRADLIFYGQPIAENAKHGRSRIVVTYRILEAFKGKAHDNVDIVISMLGTPPAYIVMGVKPEYVHAQKRWLFGHSYYDGSPCGSEVIEANVDSLRQVRDSEVSPEQAANQIANQADTRRLQFVSADLDKIFDNWDRSNPLYHPLLAEIEDEGQRELLNIETAYRWLKLDPQKALDWIEKYGGLLEPRLKTEPFRSYLKYTKAFAEGSTKAGNVRVFNAEHYPSSRSKKIRFKLLRHPEEAEQYLQTDEVKKDPRLHRAAFKALVSFDPAAALEYLDQLDHWSDTYERFTKVYAEQKKKFGAWFVSQN